MARIPPKYPAYKDSGIEWIGPIPRHWGMNKIGRMMSLGRGRVLSNLEIDEHPGPYPVYSSQVSDQGIFGKINTYDYEGKYITWTTDGINAGTAFVRSGRFNCTNACGTMKPQLPGLHLPYFAYLLNIATKNHVRYYINPKMTRSEMAEISVCLPPNVEQRTITQFLNKKTGRIDDLISRKQRLVKLLTEKRQGIIHQAVTKGLNSDCTFKGTGIKGVGKIPVHWKTPELKWVIRSVSNGTIVPQIAKSDFPVSRIETLSGGEIDFDKVGYIAPEDVQQNFILKKGDILLSHVNSLECIGNCALFDSDRFLAHGIHVLRIVPGDRIIPKYLLYVLKSHGFRHSVRTISKLSICQVSITSPDLMALKVCLPPYKEQRTIVKYLDKNVSLIDDALQTTERQIHLLQEYRTTLITNAVTGKNDVRHWGN